MSEDLDQQRPAGVVPRVLGFCIDAALIGLAGVVVGLVGFSFFAAIGDWGRLVGLAFSVTYFALLPGPRNQGQTLGQRVTKIRVVARDGRPAKLSARIIRTLVLTAPFMLNGVTLGATTSPAQIAWTVVVALVSSLGMANIYFLIFNRRNGQCLHDLLAGTWVVSAAALTVPTRPPLWKGHWVVVGLSAAVLAGGGIAAYRYLSRGRFAALLETQRAVELLPEVRNAGVVEGKSWVNGVGHTSFGVTVRMRHKPADFELAAYPVAATALAHATQARRADVLFVNVVYGFDIGIASSWVRKTYSHPAAEWPAVR